jgi:ketosteroid isomerase-like protein
MRPASLFALLLIALAACDKPAEKQPDPANPPAEVKEPVAEPAEQGGAKPPESPAPAIEQAQIEELVQAWLDAQNRGDLEAYAGLYASRFTGVRRVGERASSFDREGWIKDRGRMFKKPMKVEANNLSISATAASAVVIFEQVWQSGSYRDVGPKQLIVVREGDALKIAREELLSSQIEGAQTSFAAIAPAVFGHVITRGEVMVLLTSGAVDPDNVKHGPAQSVERGYAAWARLDEQPAAQELELFGPAGKVCDVKAGEAGIFSHVVPHFGQIQTWNGELDGLPRADDAAVAEGVMRLAGEQGSYMALKVDKGACEGATWGRVKQAQPAVVFPAVDTAPLLVRAKAEIEKTAAWKAIQKEYAADEQTAAAAAAGGKWSDVEATTHIGAWQAPDGKTVYVAYAVRAGHGCGQFEGQTWALWRVLGGDAWTLLSDPKGDGGMIEPTSAADLDGDGLPELIAPDALIQPAGTVWRRSRDMAAPYFDCPC